MYPFGVTEFKKVVFEIIPVCCTTLLYKSVKSFFIFINCLFFFFLRQKIITIINALEKSRTTPLNANKTNTKYDQITPKTNNTKLRYQYKVQ